MCVSVTQENTDPKEHLLPPSLFTPGDETGPIAKVCYQWGESPQVWVLGPPLLPRTSRGWGTVPMVTVETAGCQSCPWVWRAAAAVR